MFMYNNRAPRVQVRDLGNKYSTPVSSQKRNHLTASFNGSIIDRIAGLKSGCGSCGK
jgi:hypothetical protein